MASKKKVSKARKETPEAETMEELLAGNVLPIALSRGQKIKGKITAITRQNVVVDIGGKSEGLVAERAFAEAKDFVKTLKVGDEITASVLIPETPDGYTILSLRTASYDSTWRKIEDSQKTGKPIKVTGKSSNSAGVMVEIDNLSGFIPTSLLGKSAASNTQALIGSRFDALVIESNRDQNKIVLSEKDVSEAAQIKLALDALSKVKEGEVYEGQVTKIYSFGAFVKIKIPGKMGKPTPIEGLVHVSELSWQKVTDPKEKVSEKEKVKVKVIGKVGGKLALSIKQAEPDPWDTAANKYKKDAKVKGKVVKISDYGAFVQLTPGVEGLVHMTKIPPGEKLEVGRDVNVYVEDIDSKTRKLSLGLVLTRKPVGYK